VIKDFMIQGLSSLVFAENRDWCWWGGGGRGGGRGEGRIQGRGGRREERKAQPVFSAFLTALARTLSFPFWFNYCFQFSEF